MKKLEIKDAFTDKHNGRAYKVGEVVEFEDKRANELLKTKLVKLVK